jgi:outer membrane immunogenic protein
MNARRLSAATIAVAIQIAAATAFDAASPAKAATPAPVAVFNWTGFYIGLNAGGFDSNANIGTSTTCTPGQCYFIDTNTTNLFNSTGSRRVNSAGFVGGAEAGFNWQAGNFVAGIETDFQSYRQNGFGSGTAIYPTLAPSKFTVSQSFSTEWLWTLRPRIGVTSNNWLFYATGGLAVTSVKANWSFIDDFADAESASMSKTRTGWTIGGGAEYALSKRWSLKAEYLHLDFGNLQMTTNNLLDSGVSPVPGQIFVHSVSLRSDAVRVGVNYRLGAP